MTSRVRRSLPAAALGVAGARSLARVAVDRASPADLMQLAADVGPAPMHVGAVLVLGAGPGFSVEQALRLLGERIAAVPRLRQRLFRAPPGCGRPFWPTTRHSTCATTSGRCPARYPVMSGRYWVWPRR